MGTQHMSSVHLQVDHAASSLPGLLPSRWHRGDRGHVNPGPTLYLPPFYVSVKTTSIYFAIKAAHDENSEACQTHRDAKWSGEHWQ